jgi:large subunit ribosomal protein L31
MKAGLHPNYVEATVTCACGNTFTTRSTKPQLRTDLCGECHPFYTGEQRIVDSAGQVERFMRRMETAAGGSRPSKRQLRLSSRAAEREAQRRREEAAPSDLLDESNETDAQVAARSDGSEGAEVPPTPTPVQPDAVAAGVPIAVDERQAVTS